jgi:hypothetical protein
MFKQVVEVSWAETGAVVGVDIVLNNNSVGFG